MASSLWAAGGERIVETAEMDNMYARRRMITLLRRLGVLKALEDKGSRIAIISASALLK